jgi:putative RNA 2'-phosphotransferase
LLTAAWPKVRLTREELLTVVARFDKQRFALDDAGLRIRANQGHSTEVDLQLEPAEPPAVLFHGTAVDSVADILRDGLSRMARHHVHLSPDESTARKVGARHGKPVILVVDAAAMRAAGVEFYRTANGVWLVDRVELRWLSIPDQPRT